MDDIHSPPRTIPSAATDGSRSGGNKPRNVINSSSRLFDRGPLYHPLARRSTTTKPRATSPARVVALCAHIFIKQHAIQRNGYGCRPPGVSRVWRRPAERGTNRRKLWETPTRVIFCDNGGRNRVIPFFPASRPFVQLLLVRGEYGKWKSV